jgi:hypothetical protein
VRYRTETALQGDDPIGLLSDTLNVTGPASVPPVNP